MDFFDFVVAVFAGNGLTLMMVWGFMQLNKYDYKAPWAAYIAVLLPVALLVMTIYVTEGLPPQFDALAPQ